MAQADSRIWSLTSSAAAHIYDTFRVTDAKAQELAQGMVDTISGHGGDPAGFTSDALNELIEKHLGDHFEWRDEAKKQAAAQRRQSKVDAYQAFLDAQRPSPFKKW